ncbi:MAG: S8 family serine peptidase [Myxococcota bacterium]
MRPLPRAGRLLLLLLLAGCGADPAVQQETPLHEQLALDNEHAAAMYIIQLRDDVDLDEVLDELSIRHAAPLHHRYRHALRGGALMLNARAVREVAQDPRVLRVERDQPISAAGRSNNERMSTGFRLVGADVTSNEGTGVSVAILDTGVDLTHKDLSANISTTYGKDCINESGGTLVDNNGHGSHVAGIVGARDNSIGAIGVASAVKLVPIKVLNRYSQGSWASIICGVDHVTANASVLRVANLSLAGPGTECRPGTGCTPSALQLAIERSVAAGVTYVVAAGNEGGDAAYTVPAAFDVVVTVSAYRDANGVLSSDDGWLSYTNYGADVDIAAPGADIYSTYRSGAYWTLSGTSMAAPHVSAAAAMILRNRPGASPADVRWALLSRGIRTYPGSGSAQHPEPLLDVRTGFSSP